MKCFSLEIDLTVIYIFIDLNIDIDCTDLLIFISIIDNEINGYILYVIDSEIKLRLYFQISNMEGHSLR
jgi:hypothetical protein